MLAFEKVLDSFTIDTLYKPVRAMNVRGFEEEDSMMTSRTYPKPSTKWQPCAAMCPLVCALGLTLTAASRFGGRLGQVRSINSRIRH